MRFWRSSPINPAVGVWQRWRRRALIAGGAAAACGLLAGLGLAAVIVRYGQIDRARPADVIIVLGGGSPSTERRARHAATLYARDLAPVLLCSGGYRSAPDAPTEADHCAETAQAAGVPAAAILRETNSLSTRDNASAAADLMAAHGWRSAVLVTDDYHLWRAAWVFRRAGLKVFPSPAQATQDGPPRGEWVFGLLREMAAVGWYALDWLRGQIS